MRIPLVMILALLLTACGGGSDSDRAEPLTPGASASAITDEINEFTRDLIRFDQSGLQVEFAPIEVDGVSRSELFWRVGDGALRLDEVKVSSDGRSHGTAKYDPEPMAGGSLETFICDWSPASQHDFWVDCIGGNPGVQGRESLDFVYLLTTQGGVIETLPAETIAGRRTDCYRVRYIWRLAPLDGRLCVDPELGAPLSMVALESGVGFRATRVLEEAQGVLKPTVGPDGSYSGQPIDVLHLPNFNE